MLVFCLYFCIYQKRAFSKNKEKIVKSTDSHFHEKWHGEIHFNNIHFIYIFNICLLHMILINILYMWILSPLIYAGYCRTRNYIFVNLLLTSIGFNHNVKYVYIWAEFAVWSLMFLQWSLINSIVNPGCWI